MTQRKPRRQLIIIGGAEEKEDHCEILEEFVRRAGGRQARVVVMTVATTLPEELGPEYEQIFGRLGVKQVCSLTINDRTAAQNEGYVQAISEASGLFFTGGSQLRITGLLGGTTVDAALRERAGAGVVIAGTSAGASMMSDTMLITGDSETNPGIGMVEMSPGMGFLPGVVIDQHFAQRGRIGRLLAAVAQHPRHLGLGIDENTALVVEDEQFGVIGAGAVTVVDAAPMTYSNVHESQSNDCLALCDVRLHILPAGYRFDLAERQPLLEREEGK
ncbi:MAG: cyanophycinase [Roseiflexaceae bacterium]